VYSLCNRDSSLEPLEARILVNVTKHSTERDLRIERVLAYLVAISIALAVMSFVAVVVATAAGQKDFDTGAWPAVLTMPYFSLPLGVVFIITLLVFNGRRRQREYRDGHN
jgi:TRAP-type C4-dicarboxylate transport system permease small subunit